MLSILVIARMNNMAAWTRRFWQWHRWLAWLVGLQLAAWVIGGAVFAWLPFQAWVKSTDTVTKPVVALPSDWAQALTRATLPNTPVRSVASVATARGPAWQIRLADQSELWLTADGKPLVAPDETAARTFAQSLYRGVGQLRSVERVEQVPRQLGIVRELGAKRGLWVARFDDAIATRIYIDAVNGQLAAARNDAWVIYDFFWRLHVMDYSEGEDFNNPLLRAAALIALVLVVTGGVLLGLSARRWWRRRELAKE